jgi:hypothetical protein
MKEKPVLLLSRTWQDENQTLGNLVIYDKDNRPLFSAITLERGWRNNERNVSCVPLGTYKIVLEYSNRFKTELWELKDVPNRSECKFHSANYWYQLNGCISLGVQLLDINKDGYVDVTQSKRTMSIFHDVLRDYKELELIIS